MEQTNQTVTSTGSHWTGISTGRECTITGKFELELIFLHFGLNISSGTMLPSIMHFWVAEVHGTEAFQGHSKWMQRIQQLMTSHFGRPRFTLKFWDLGGASNVIGTGCSRSRKHTCSVDTCLLRIMAWSFQGMASWQNTVCEMKEFEYVSENGRPKLFLKVYVRLYRALPPSLSKLQSDQ